MALSTAAKIGIGGLGTASVGAPTAYVVWDKYFSLNEVETSILKDETLITVEEANNVVTAKSTTTLKVPGAEDSASYKWECKLSVEGLASGDGSKLKTYLVKYLPTTAPSEEAKKIKFRKNKEAIVKACSKDRKEEEKTTHTHKSEAKVTINKTTSGEIDGVSLFDKENLIS